MLKTITMLQTPPEKLLSKKLLLLILNEGMKLIITATKIVGSDYNSIPLFLS
jgi:hypothetical protein